MYLHLLVAVLGFTYVSAIQRRPLVIWHGLGKKSLSGLPVEQQSNLFNS